MLKKYRALIIAVALTLLIKIISLFPSFIEAYYSEGVYPVISRMQRFLTGWIPFSLGDILYATFLIWILVRLIGFIKKLILRKLSLQLLLTGLRNLIFFVLWVYIVFNLLWGLNYNRLGIGEQLQIKPGKYSTRELKMLIQLSIDRMKQLSEQALKDRSVLYNKKYLFNRAIEAYENAKNKYLFLNYYPHSVKPSIFSYLGNYLGYSGYYNPFTGESQVNTTVPVFLQPFTTTHEIGHQLGYAKEMEANFAGFLAASESKDAAVQYSVYFDLYIYANRNLWFLDSVSAKTIAQGLPAIVKNDIRELKAFYIKYENPFEPVIRKIYGQYLRANQQPQGMLSYDEVVAWVIAYFRKTNPGWPG